MSEALTKREERAPVAWDGAQGIKIASLDEAYRFAKYVVASGLAPKGDTPEAVIVKAQFGAELGLSFLQSLTSVNVINGRPNLNGETTLALIRNSGICTKLHVGNDGSGDGRCGFVDFERKDGTADRVAFTLADAKRAKLTERNAAVWSAYQDDMLVWRAVSRAAKRYFSDVIHGFEVAEVHREYREVSPGVSVARASLPAPSSPDPIFDGEADPSTDDHPFGEKSVSDGAEKALSEKPSKRSDALFPPERETD